jgi:hypothetical protein
MKLMRMLAVTALLASSHLVYGQDETPVMTANVLPSQRPEFPCPRASM